jgi:hypothetical protein
MKSDIFKNLSMTTKTKSMACWVEGKPNTKSILTFSHESSRTDNKVYNLTFKKRPFRPLTNNTSLHKTRYLT